LISRNFLLVLTADIPTDYAGVKPHQTPLRIIWKDWPSNRQDVKARNGTISDGSALLQLRGAVVSPT
jgi:hypothetical protein